MNVHRLVERLAALTETPPPISDASAIAGSIQVNELGEATAAEIHRRAAAWSAAVAEYGQTATVSRKLSESLFLLPSLPCDDVIGV